ncbi:TPA: hypothetical protein DCZ15_00720 [Candidatus Falkowbacteria bacterium]|nr:MAG: hypothetical protein UV95_C0003G0004 [Candidatus Falkowbacteria bacterium GW2011_GWF2_43_32]HBA36377.1 hypothetical protein [Candidatus Falkowbacteria bacterium]
MLNFEQAKKSNKAVENFDKKSDNPLNRLLSKESFVADSADEREVDEYFNGRTILKDIWKKVQENINPKILSNIKLGLKIFLISKMIGGMEIQAQAPQEFQNNKNNIEYNAGNDKMGEIKDNTFIIGDDNDQYLQNQTERDKIGAYLQELGLDSVNFHTKDSKLFGQYAQIHEQYQEFANVNPAFLRFGSALYSGQYRLKDKKSDLSEAFNKMIPVKDSVSADEIAQELYIEFCAQHGVDPAKQLYFNHGIQSSFIGEEFQGVKFALISVGEETTKSKYYNPAFVTAIHELNHLQRFTEIQAGRDLKMEALGEVYTRIQEVINKDYIYKKINKIPLEEVVVYPEELNSDYLGGLSLGLVANTFRELLKKYETIEECLMSPSG